ncbi:MAG: hypothetical protein QXK88_04810 [Desulfurococcaceae archaeon]
MGKNAEVPAYIHLREKRYGGLKRLYRISVDLIRGHAISIDRLLVNRSKRGFAFYLPSKLAGFYKAKEPDNISWIDKAILAKAIPPREAGIAENYFTLPATLYLLRAVKGGENAIDSYVLSLVERTVYKASLNTREMRVVYFKELDMLGREYLPLIVKIHKL